jgi:hypothetical protein
VRIDAPFPPHPLVAGISLKRGKRALAKYQDAHDKEILWLRQGAEAGPKDALISDTRLHGRVELHPGEDRYSIAVWQRYAESVWTDISQSDVLSRAQARDEKDERHISPLQLTPIRRCLDLWTNPGDVVFSPFAGIGSELYVALQMGRRAIGVELKPSYFRQALKNCEIAAAPRSEQRQAQLCPDMFIEKPKPIEQARLDLA